VSAAPRRARSAALAALTLIAVVWGYNWVVLKQALRDAGPYEFFALRFVIASLCLFGALAATRRPMRLTHAGSVLAIGLLQTTATFALTGWALVSGAAGKSAVLCYTMPFWVILFAWPVLGERLGRAQWGALLIALAGLALLLGAGITAGVSELLALASALAWAAGIVITKRLQTRHRVDTLALSAWQSVLGGAGLVLLALLFPSRPTQWTPNLLFALLYNGVLVSAICWYLWFWVLGRLDAGLASFGILAVPVLGVVFGVLELGERPQPLEWAGIGLIVVALALTAVAVRGARPAA
jgi:drug/metabolite transporter (DMT)-like permease